MSELHLVIGNKAYSSWSLRPWIAMKANALAFRETMIPIKQPDTNARIRAFSAAAKVPVLLHGDVTVWESLAILDYLADTFPDKPWWPADPAARALARAVAAEMHAGFSSLRGHMTMNLRASVPNKSRPPEVNADIARIAQIWNDCRGRFGKPGPFLFGAFSNADAMYAPVVTRFKTYGVLETLDEVSQSYCRAMLDFPPMREWYGAAAGEGWSIPEYESLSQS
jgi:glutathione S-transferase